MQLLLDYLHFTNSHFHGLFPAYWVVVLNTRDKAFEGLVQPKPANALHPAAMRGHTSKGRKGRRREEKKWHGMRRNRKGEEGREKRKKREERVGKGKAGKGKSCAVKYFP